MNKSLSSRIHVDGRRCVCYIVYENKNARGDDAAMDHEGTVILVFLLRKRGLAPKEISGSYFTNKPRSKSALDDKGTHDEIYLTKLEDENS